MEGCGYMRGKKKKEKEAKINEDKCLKAHD